MMFLAAFPIDDDKYLEKEVQRIKLNFDLPIQATSDGPDPLCKAGLWVSAELTTAFAPDYGLAEIIRPLASAKFGPARYMEDDLKWMRADAEKEAKRQSVIDRGCIVQ